MSAPPDDRYARALEAEQREDWETAIALVAARAVCYSPDHLAHAHHLWHLDLLARAGRLAELAVLADGAGGNGGDVHARRRLDRALRERGMAAQLRERAAAGDGGALYRLVRLLGGTGRAAQARRVVRELGARDAYAHRLLDGFRERPDG
ncbi:hypothetical protein [Kitasatospora sp. NPDC085464]|uniref:hypothetical protein n=1 Tax=Kitasatospora sp. NPDC085464 TaxID=3364063 RepID=UPI0037CAFD75